MASDSTLDDVRTTGQTRFAVVGRRFAVAVMALVVLVAAAGWLGVKAQTARATGDGYHLTLTYPRVARAGLDIPWELRLTHPGGFPTDIVIAVSANYYDIFEFQGMHPNPSDETATAKFVYLTFSAPPGDVFTLSLDTYVQPASQIGRSATVAALVDKRNVAQITYSTWLVP